ncbi:hypothetical protein GF359_01420 [candidate division WOR-3 bacterium]|uniref:NADH:ubiquinone oxidoreductase-like 20kDa subunit domain-containing protein n=1 Tax=candidate division WOR-3 bacterium TaxID=2052148 RepID=A0A9D5QDA1_UNCW3|nr:hypothetical protein [candidate division WOR-3 bacterium]MBD3363855.1 hypothetical protein [candidate division WOR-3 bacterium]
MNNKPKVGFYSFSGCEGDLLTILHCEDELLDIFSAVDIRSFRMASSERHDDENLDIAFIEGSITTNKHVKKLKVIRERSKIVVALGTCACYGGPQSARLGYNDWEERFKKVYGSAKLTVAKPFESQPLDEFIKVDYRIPGCPIDKYQFFYALTRLAKGMPVELTKFPVCAECKWNENECLLLKGQLCLGPITAGGCNSRCPNHGLPCIGCWGPTDEANVASEINLLKEKDFSAEEIINKLRLFGGAGMVRRFGELLGIKPKEEKTLSKTQGVSKKKREKK